MSSQGTVLVAALVACMGLLTCVHGDPLLPGLVTASGPNGGLIGRGFDPIFAKVCHAYEHGALRPVPPLPSGVSASRCCLSPLSWKGALDGFVYWVPFPSVRDFA